MTRSGKSNTTKTIAAAIFKLRAESVGQRVGQLIFDPNGEYANDNPQDQGCLRNIQYEVADAEGEVQTYGSYRHPNDPNRNITKFNFYGDKEPAAFQTDVEEVRESLEPLRQGKQIINDALAEETGGYISAFTAADVFGGDDTPCRESTLGSDGGCSSIGPFSQKQDSLPRHGLLTQVGCSTKPSAI